MDAAAAAADAAGVRMLLISLSVSLCVCVSLSLCLSVCPCVCRPPAVLHVLFSTTLKSGGFSSFSPSWDFIAIALVDGGLGRRVSLARCPVLWSTRAISFSPGSGLTTRRASLRQHVRRNDHYNLRPHMSPRPHMRIHIHQARSLRLLQMTNIIR